jgi:hypothetical protein
VALKRPPAEALAKDNGVTTPYSAVRLSGGELGPWSMCLPQRLVASMSLLIRALVGVMPVTMTVTTAFAGDT